MKKESSKILLDRKLTIKKILLFDLDDEIDTKTNEDDHYSILENVDIDIKMQILKEAAGFIKENPKMKIEVNLQSINLNVNSTIYEAIKNIDSILSDDFLNTLEMLQTEKKKILENAIKIDILHLWFSKSQSWKKFFVVLSEGYLYFFVSAKDLAYNRYIFVKDCVVLEYKDKVSPEGKNAFSVNLKKNLIMRNII